MSKEKILVTTVREYRRNIEGMLRNINPEEDNNGIILELENIVVYLKMITDNAARGMNIHIERGEDNVRVLNRAITLINEHYDTHHQMLELSNPAENVESSNGWLYSVALAIASFACVYIIHSEHVHDPSGEVDFNGCEQV